MEKNDGILCSVIVATYKQIESIENVIHSIIDQDYKNIEIIVADDGTPDFDEKKIKKKYESICQAQGIRFLILHLEENKGTVKNLNNGVKHARGEVIVTIAGDNFFYHRSVISNIIKSYCKEGWLIATGKQAIFFNGEVKEVRPYKREINYIKYEAPEKLAVRLVSMPCFIAGSVTIYSRKVFETFGYFDENYILLEDCPYYVNFLSHRQKIFFIDEILIKHMLDDRNIRRHPQLIKDDLKVIDQLDKSLFNWLQRRLLRYRKLCLRNELSTGKYYILNIKYMDCIIYILFLKYMNRFEKIKK